MDLWIMAQDKKRLIKCEDIGIDTFYDEFRIYAYKDYNSSVNKVILGDYKTEEKALKILEDILHKISFGLSVNRIIYIMPKRS